MRTDGAPSREPTLIPLVSSLPLLDKYRKCLSSGRNSGKRWISSGVANFVTAVGTPPAAETRSMAVPGPGEKTITPSLFHDPPRPLGASQMVCGGPPASATFFNFPGTKYPMKALSGDQNG